MGPSGVKFRMFLCKNSRSVSFRVVSLVFVRISQTNHDLFMSELTICERSKRLKPSLMTVITG